MREMELMPEWFLRAASGAARLEPPSAPCSIGCSRRWCKRLGAARRFVHRDYHSRNLLVTAENNPGILDFQDAVWGPVTYDLVSLLKDCYIAWPRAAGARMGARSTANSCWRPGFALGRDRAASSCAGSISIGSAAAHQGAGNFRAPVLSRRQAAIPQGFAARAALRARCGRAHTRRPRSSPNSSPGASSRNFPARRSARSRERACRRAAARGHDSGGRARRALRPLTDATPKPLLRVRGEPLIERHVERPGARRHRSASSSIWPGWDRRSATILGDGARYGVAITYSEETPRALETGGRHIPRTAAPRSRTLRGGQRRHLHGFSVRRRWRSAPIAMRTSCWCRTRRSTRRAISAWSRAWRCRRPRAQYTFSGIARVSTRRFLPAAPTACSP